MALGQGACDARRAPAVSRIKALAPWFELRAPVGGNTTINASRVTLKPDGATGALYLNEHGPSLRALYDLRSG